MTKLETNGQIAPFPELVQPMREISLGSTDDINTALVYHYPDLVKLDVTQDDRLPSNYLVEQSIQKVKVAGAAGGRRIERTLSLSPDMNSLNRAAEVMNEISVHDDFKDVNIAEFVDGLLERTWPKAAPHIMASQKTKEGYRDTFLETASHIVDMMESRRTWAQRVSEYGKNVADAFLNQPPETKLDHMIASTIAMREPKYYHTHDVEPDYVNAGHYLLFALAVTQKSDPAEIAQQALASEVAEPILAKRFLTETLIQPQSSNSTVQQIRFMEALFPEATREELIVRLAEHRSAWPNAIHAENKSWKDLFTRKFTAELEKVQRFAREAATNAVLDERIEAAETELSRCLLESIKRNNPRSVLPSALRMTKRSERSSRRSQSSNTPASAAVSDTVEVLPVIARDIFNVVSSGPSSYETKEQKDYFAEYAEAHRGDTKIVEDMESCKEYLQTVTRSEGRVSGFKPYGTKIINDESVPIYQFKPLDAAGLSLRSKSMRECRIYFAFTNKSEGVAILGVVHRSDADEFVKRNTLWLKK